MHKKSRNDLGLTPIEIRALVLLANGETTDAISRKLGMRANATRSMLARIYRKMGVSNGVAAVARALVEGILDKKDIRVPKVKDRANGMPQVERDALSWLFLELNVHQVAARMRVTYKTVDGYLLAARERLQVSSTPEAIQAARELGLLNDSILRMQRKGA